MVSASVRWSVSAGIYTFLAGVGLLVPLWIVARTLVGILGLRTGFTAFVVPGSGAVIGTVIWWAIIEHRETYTYLRGGAGGLLTALLTVCFWTLLVAIVWDLLAVQSAMVVILFVLVVVSPVAFVAWLPIIYARRYWESGQSEQKEPAIQ